MIVQIDPSVTEQQRNDQRFQNLHRNATEFFNSADFIQQERHLTSLHEAGHIVFARRIRAADIEFHPPTMVWDNRPEYDCPAISKGSVSWATPPDCPVIDALKAHIAGYVVREAIGSPNDDVAIGSDLDGAKDYFDAIGGNAQDFESAVEQAKQEILEDLQNPLVTAEIYAAAKEFQQAIFPDPKLTREILRRRRLGHLAELPL